MRRYTIIRVVLLLINKPPSTDTLHLTFRYHHILPFFLSFKTCVPKSDTVSLSATGSHHRRVYHARSSFFTHFQLVHFLAIAVEILGGHFLVKGLLFGCQTLPSLRDHTGEIGKGNLAMGLAVATLLGAVAEPMTVQQLLLLGLRILSFVSFSVQDALALVAKEKVVGTQGLDGLVDGRLDQRHIIGRGALCLLELSRSKKIEVAIVEGTQCRRRVCCFHVGVVGGLLLRLQTIKEIALILRSKLLLLRSNLALELARKGVVERRGQHELVKVRALVALVGLGEILDEVFKGVTIGTSKANLAWLGLIERQRRQVGRLLFMMLDAVVFKEFESVKISIALGKLFLAKASICLLLLMLLLLLLEAQLLLLLLHCLLDLAVVHGVRLSLTAFGSGGQNEFYEGKHKAKHGKNKA